MSRHAGRGAVWETVPATTPIPSWYYRGYDVVPIAADPHASGQGVVVLDRVRGGGGYSRSVWFRPLTEETAVVDDDRAGWTYEVLAYGDALTAVTSHLVDNS